MAKNTKGGLGRGLNSLMGGYEAPAEPAPRTVVQPEPKKVEQRVAPVREEATSSVSTRPAEREVIREEDLPQEERAVIDTEKKEKAPSPLQYTGAPARAEGVAPRTAVKDVIAKKELIEEDDGVRIKGVVERSVKPAASPVPVSFTQSQESAVEKSEEESHGGSVSLQEKARESVLLEKKEPGAVRPVPHYSGSSAVAAMNAAKAAQEKNGVELSDHGKSAGHSIASSDEVPLDMVYPNPDQPRMHFNQDELEELSASIQKDGLLQPILVRETGKGYEIIAGERRWQACKLAGMAKVPVRIKDADDMQVLELALIENLQRSDLNPIEEAYGYKRMMEKGSKTQSEVATAVSKGRSTIANALRLLDLPEEAQQLLYEEKITAGHARAILSIPTDDGRQKLTDKLKKDKISVREAESYARLLAGRAKAEGKEKKPPMPKFYRTAARSLTDSLQTKVRVRSANGKNKIEIEFKDEDDLQRLFNLMSTAE